MSEIEHAPWVGTDYGCGIDGRKIAIVGYSHWAKSQDNNDLGEAVIRDVISGAYDPAFFKKIVSYFSDIPGAATSSAFWNQVVFFNFLPSIVGNAEKRFAAGTAGQIRAGRERVIRIVEKYKPDALIIFTTKGWRQFPDTVESARGESLPWLDPTRWPSRHDWGTYQVGGKIIRAFALRHPQGAQTAEMKEAVAEIFVQLRAASAVTPRLPLSRDSL